jgi:hypothetical protein
MVGRGEHWEGPDTSQHASRGGQSSQDGRWEGDTGVSVSQMQQIVL